MKSDICRACGSSVWKAVKQRDRVARKCVRCKQWYGARINAQKLRRYENQPEFTLDRREFAAWADASPRVCYSCGIPEHLLEQIGVKTQVHLNLRFLGLDRIDNARGYSLDNIALCCLGCNRVKGSMFTSGELLGGLGAEIARVWRARLRAAGVSDPWIDEEESRHV
jgi:hypothetical protein